MTQARRHIMRFGGAVTRIELTRTKLEELTADLLDRTIEVTERTIEQAAVKGVDHFDDVLLVGGMTRMPAVAGTLRERLGLTARLHEPDLAVAKGAAQFALLRTVRPDGETKAGRAEQVAAKTGMTVPEVEQLASKRVATVVLAGLRRPQHRWQRSPRRVPTRSMPGRWWSTCCRPTPRCPPTPARTRSHTAIDNQRMVQVEVWEQAGPVASADLADNRKVGQGLLSNLPPKLPAMSPIEVTFFMSETGKLSVHAPRTGVGQCPEVRPPDRRSRPGRHGKGTDRDRPLPSERVSTWPSRTPSRRWHRTGRT